MHSPVINPAMTPSAYPLSRRTSECQVLSNSNARSLMRLWKTLAGPGKYGNGSNLTPEVTISHRQSSNAAAVKMEVKTDPADLKSLCKSWEGRFRIEAKERGQAHLPNLRATPVAR